MRTSQTMTSGTERSLRWREARSERGPTEWRSGIDATTADQRRSRHDPGPAGGPRSDPRARSGSRPRGGAPDRTGGRRRRSDRERRRSRPRSAAIASASRPSTSPGSSAPGRGTRPAAASPSAPPPRARSPRGPRGSTTRVEEAGLARAVGVVHLGAHGRDLELAGREPLACELRRPARQHQADLGLDQADAELRRRRRSARRRRAAGARPRRPRDRSTRSPPAPPTPNRRVISAPPSVTSFPAACGTRPHDREVEAAARASPARP